MGIPEKAGQLASRLSGGQQQREVFALMRQLSREQGTAFLRVTHDPALADRCDLIIELVDGRKTRER